MDIAGAKSVVSQIQASGGYVKNTLDSKCIITNQVVLRQAVSIKCNVTDWDDLVALFELAISKYGAVDVVVSELSLFQSKCATFTGRRYLMQV